MIRFACLGDSITSDQVTGIGTAVAQKLGAELAGNFACGYATCTDWHDGDHNMTPVTLAVPPNTNTADNVLSNQVRRVLASGAVPDVIYIAIGTNDGNQPFNQPFDDADAVLAQPYEALARCSMASALRWAIETLRRAFPKAMIFVATPLQTCTDLPWMAFPVNRMKRDVIIRIAQALDCHVIDSFYESGFTEAVARDHGEVHPDDAWKETIACYIANRIKETLNI